MGETSGYMVDPKSASVVLKSLQKLLGVNIDLSELEERAKQVDSITNQLKDIETSDKEERSDVNYIG
jgi:proteasome assembly chaperone (PAC2) family protein